MLVLSDVHSVAQSEWGKLVSRDITGPCTHHHTSFRLLPESWEPSGKRSLHFFRKKLQKVEITFLAKNVTWCRLHFPPSVVFTPLAQSMRTCWRHTRCWREPRTVGGHVWPWSLR